METHIAYTCSWRQWQ